MNISTKPLEMICWFNVIVCTICCIGNFFITIKFQSMLNLMAVCLSGFAASMNLYVIYHFSKPEKPKQKTHRKWADSTEPGP